MVTPYIHLLRPKPTESFLTLLSHILYLNPPKKCFWLNLQNTSRILLPLTIPLPFWSEALDLCIGPLSEHLVLFPSAFHTAATVHFITWVRSCCCPVPRLAMATPHPQSSQGSHSGRPPDCLPLDALPHFSLLWCSSHVTSFAPRALEHTPASGIGSSIFLQLVPSTPASVGLNLTISQRPVLNAPI